MAVSDRSAHPFGSACDGYNEVLMLPGTEQKV